jgi:predicted pyridoxine 5'-phosphate oxidase superfamily flavin-nucleotide-binding protein
MLRAMSDARIGPSLNPLPSGWHEGEREAQRRAGVADKLAPHGARALRPFMPDQHRVFFAQLPFLAIGSADETGRISASLVFGVPGFVQSPDPATLVVGALPHPADPLAAALQPGNALGVLGIELPTRRRNRANGRILTVGEKGFTLGVDQSFGNCPQYINERDYVGWVGDGPALPSAIEPLATLDDEARAMIARADTLFLATAAAAGPGGRLNALDVSHRGGPAGFLKVAADGALELPDYRGNFYFNSIGNLLTHPQAGLLIVDFENRDLLQLSGRAEVIWVGDALLRHPGAQRMIRLSGPSGRWLRRGYPIAMTVPRFSPQAAALTAG